MWCGAPPVSPKLIPKSAEKEERLVEVNSYTERYSLCFGKYVSATPYADAAYHTEHCRGRNDVSIMASEQ